MIEGGFGLRIMRYAHGTGRGARLAYGKYAPCQQGANNLRQDFRVSLAFRRGFFDLCHHDSISYLV
jgi:hypothetical protein